MTQEHIADQDRTTQRRDCYYCTKHRTGEDAPPGGWLVADGNWLVGHGPAHMSLPGTLRIESRRHFTDFADMTDAEAASFGLLLAPSGSTSWPPWTTSRTSTPGCTRAPRTTRGAGRLFRIT